MYTICNVGLVFLNQCEVLGF